MEQKDNTGVIFKNDYKEKDSQPDYKGRAMIDGVEKDLALWLNESKNGSQYLSIKFSKKYVKDVEQGGEAVDQTIKQKQKEADDLPF